MKNSFLLLLFVANIAWGQPNKSNPADTTVVTPKRKTSIGLQAGSNGFGLQLAHGFATKKNLSLRLNAHYFRLPLQNDVITIDGKSILLGSYQDRGFRLNLNGEMLLQSANLALDFHPFNHAIRLFGGVGLMFSKVDFIASPRDSLRQGDVSLSPNEQGNIYFLLKTQRVCPFLGIGFGRIFPNKRVNFSADIGSYYIGSPKLRFYTTGMLEPTSAEESKLRNNIKNYYLLPYLTFSINIRISK